MNDTSDRGGGWVAAQFALLAAIALVPPRTGGLPAWPDAIADPGRVAGLALGGAGGLLAALAAAGLGRNLTPFPRPIADGELVEHGLYGLVRHPIYTGILLASLGFALFRASTPALLLTLALALLFDRKASHEEAWLLAQYSGYAAYRQRVRKLIPWLY